MSILKYLILCWLLLIFTWTATASKYGNTMPDIHAKAPWQLTCDLENAISNLNIEDLTNESYPDSQLISTFASYNGVYINYLIVLAKENSVPSFKVDINSDIDKLEQVITNFINETYREALFLDIKLEANSSLEENSKYVRIMSYEVSFDNQKQFYSAAFQQFGDFYLAITVMPLLAKDPTELITSDESIAIIKKLVNACEVTLSKKGTLE